MNTYLKTAESNLTIYDSFIKAESILSRYDRIACSVSGGADSDVILDMCTKLDTEKKIHYIWFNTGMEYQATKDHLNYLENKYQITIERERAIESIPLCCKKYGQPFLSKLVSDYISRAQKHNFEWEDKPYKVLIEKYPKLKSFISWWCNTRDTGDYGYSAFNINYNKYLKEFLILNPPKFPISSKCCKYAKKEVSKKYVKDHNIQLMIIGIRKAEGGVRSKIYHSCFLNDKANGFDKYFPLFWYSNSDKREYENLFEVTHSECYTKYGLQRTGCIGCPYNKNINDELNVIETYEPKLLL